MAYKIGGRIVPNFSLTEMCNKLADEDVKLVLSPEMVEHAFMMQELRDWYGKPLNVSSWYRTKSFNSKCGGSNNSLHLLGLATDINNIPSDKYKDFTTAWSVICKSHNKVGGVNYYDWGMHFSSAEDKFGYKEFVIRDERGAVEWIGVQ